MKEFGQRSVASLLRASSGSRRSGAQVSLADFLDRKSVASTGGPNEQSCMHAHEHTQPDAAPPAPSKRVCDSLTTHRLSKKRKRIPSHQKSWVVIEQQQQSDCGGRPHLLVLGDAPVHRSKSNNKLQLNHSHNYNHYADGNGWWGEEMVGMEEAGTSCEWEGVASMSLGSAAPTSQ